LAIEILGEEVGDSAALDLKLAARPRAAGHGKRDGKRKPGLERSCRVPGYAA
jgi:hypothetical protein